MGSIPKFVGVLSCGALLCLGLSTATQAGYADSAADDMQADQTDRRQGGQEVLDKQLTDPVKGAQSQHTKTITGEVLRVEGDNYFVNGMDGKEVRLHTDDSTKMTGNIRQGDHIEADVNDQNHALSIRSARGTDK
jgi:hypothetical protein